MSRKTSKMKSVQGERLSLLLKEQGIDQKKLAEAINISQQSITKWMYGTKMTRNNAKEILRNYSRPKLSDDLEEKIKMHPLLEDFYKYETEWLLGESDFKNKAEETLHALGTALTKSEKQTKGFELILSSLGFVVSAPTVNELKHIDIDEKNVIISAEDISGNVSTIEYLAVENEIIDFIEFKMRRLLNGKLNGGSLI